MPPQKGIYEVWDPKSKSTYEFWWDKDTEPDYDSFLADINGTGGQTKKSALSRLGEGLGESLTGTGKIIRAGLFPGYAQQDFVQPIASSFMAPKSAPDPNAKPKTMWDRVGDVAEFAGVPVSRLKEGDYAGALGQALPDLLLGGMAGRAGRLANRAAKAAKPITKAAELVDDLPTGTKALGDGGRITREDRMIPDVASPTNTGTTFYAGSKGTVPANTRYYYDSTNHAIIKGDHTLLPEDLPELTPLSNEVAISTLGQVPKYRMKLSDDLVAGEAMPGAGKPMSLKEYIVWKGTSRQSDITKELAKGGKPITHKQPYVEHEGYFKLPRQIKVNLEVPGPIGASKKKPMQGELTVDNLTDSGYPGTRNAMEVDDVGTGPGLGLPRGDGLDKPSAPFKGKLTPERAAALKKQYQEGDTIDVEMFPGERVENGRIVKGRDPLSVEYTQPGPGRTAFQKTEGEKLRAKTDPKDGLIDPKKAFETDVQGDTLVGGIHKGYRAFMEAMPELQGITDKWIKLRGAAKTEALKVRYDFQNDIGKYTKDQLPEFQKLMEDGSYANVRTYFDNKLNWLKAHGVTLDSKDNYLPQLWDNPPDEVKAVFKLDRDKSLVDGKPGNKTISSTAPFEFRSLIKDYEEGIAKGLKPKYSPLELMEWYEERANKLVADRDFLNELKKRKIIIPSNQRPVINDPAKQWLDIDTNAMRPLQLGERQVAWATDPRYKKVIENQLSNPDDMAARGANFVSGSKSISLSAGLPYTGFNIYGSMMAKRAAMEGGVSRLSDAVKFMFRPQWGDDYIREHSEDMVKWAREGLTLGMTDDIKLGKVFDDPKGWVGKKINQGVDLQHEMFEKPMFKKMIPALKLISVEDNFKKLKNSGLSEEAAKKKAVEFVNEQYASINYDLLYRDKQFQNVSRIFLISPSLLESNYKMAKGMARAIAKPGTVENQIYLKMAGRTLATYGAANVLNIINTGKPMWENDNGREFDIAMGKDAEGNNRYFRLFGSESDLFKIPINAVMEAVRGEGSLAGVVQPVVNKMSPLASAAYNTMRGQTREGDPTWTSWGGRDKFGKEVPLGDRMLGTVDTLASSFLPQTAQAGIKLARGKGWEQSIGGALESPLIYSKGEKKKKGLFAPLKPSRPRLPNVDFNR